MAALDAATGKPSSVPSNGCAPAFRAPARPAAAACQRVEKDIRVVWRGPGIDGPSRPRRCPRPTCWRGAGLGANWRAAVPALLLVTDDHGAFGAIGSEWRYAATSRHATSGQVGKGLKERW